MLDVAIQIVNYKTKKWLVDCVQDVVDDLKGSSISYVINILDNASGEDLTDIAELYQDVNVFYSKKNLGFGSGHNFLSKKSLSKYILILNPDLKFIEKDTIIRLLEKMKKTGVQVVGPMLLTSKGKLQAWDHGEEDVCFSLANYLRHPEWAERKSDCESSWVSGAVFLTLRKSFEKVNGFDENFFLYTEELDLCLRMRQFGANVIYCPDIKVQHIGSVVARKSKHMWPSLIYFFKKHYLKNNVK